MVMNWHGAQDIQPRDYRCGHTDCGREVASRIGYYASNDGSARIYICPRCDLPTYFYGERLQIPDVAPGSDVEGVPEDVDGLYVQARRCVSVAAYTASVLASRKLLMNIAVDQGAGPGKSFIDYVNYLAEKGYVPPGGKGWVDHIRKKGNEATHEIPDMSRDDALELIAFTEMLLKFIYEFPAKVPVAEDDQLETGVEAKSSAG